MTDPVSTIRQALNAGRGTFTPHAVQQHLLVERALAACDALEAERLTPEEARWIISNMPKDYSGRIEWPYVLAKLERIAGGDNG